MKKKKKSDNNIKISDFKININTNDINNFETINSNSWFSIKKLNYSSNVVTKDNKTKKKEPKQFVRNKTIELFLNEKQKNILKEWFTYYKYSYNQTIKFINSNKPRINFIDLRPLVKKSFSSEMKTKITNSKIPEHTIDEAIRDVVTAYKSAFENLKQGNIKFFRIRYKKDKSPRVSLKLEGTSFPNGNLQSLTNFNKNEPYNLDLLYESSFKKYKSINSFCTSTFGKNIKTSESIIDIERTSNIVWNKRTNRWFLKTPIDKKSESIPEIETRDVCAIDPGIRTFATVYGTKQIYQIGENYQEMVNKELKKIDVLKEKIKLLPKIKSKFKDLVKMKKRVNIIQQKIENRVDDMHYKTSKILCENFRTVLLGNLSTKAICSNKNILSRTTKRQCYSLKLYEFKNKMTNCAELLNTRFELVTEHYTSKTCSNCRRRNVSSSNEIFKCDYCNFKINRDIQGSYNIFYKHFNKMNNDLKKI